jgi:membrane protease subunit HflC
MNLKKIILALIAIAAVLVVIALLDSTYVIEEGQQGFLTQWGNPAGPERTQAGWYWKLPLIQHVNYFDHRILEWDGNANLVSTRDKRLIYVAPYARWGIVHPIQFFQKFRDEGNAISRLDDVLDGATKTTVANHELADIVRSRARVAEDDSAKTGSLASQEQSRLVDFSYGREKIEEEIKKLSAATIEEWGCELLDVRLQRVKYEPENLSKITSRMSAERISVAEKYRSEGRGEADRILGERDRELKRLLSEAYRKSEEIRGDADATAARIYSAAYTQHKDAAEFYQFITLLELYPTLIQANDTIILSTDSDLLRYLKAAQGASSRKGKEQ